MISGIGMRAVLPMSPYAVALSVVVALCLILFLDALHPPALANAGFAYSAHATVSELLQLTAATVAVLAICAVCLSRWTERTGRGHESGGARQQRRRRDKPATCCCCAMNSRNANHPAAKIRI